MHAAPLALVLSVSALALAACGADDDAPAERAAASAEATTADTPDRYCSLTRDLDTAGEAFFAKLGRDATDEEYEAAERGFVERFAPELDAIEQAAPAAIADDVSILLAGQRQRAGLDAGPSVTQREVSAAERRIQAFEKRSCARG